MSMSKERFDNLQDFAAVLNTLADFSEQRVHFTSEQRARLKALAGRLRVLNEQATEQHDFDAVEAYLERGEALMAKGYELEHAEQVREAADFVRANEGEVQS